jgi:hypothetical protein
MPSAAAPLMSRSQRRRPSRRKRKALLAGLLSPVLLAGPINPAAAAIMQYEFSGEFSKTPKKGFDWLVGARLEGKMRWDSTANNGSGAFTDWNVESYRSDWQKQQEIIGSQTSPEIDSKIRGLQTKISYLDNPELLNKALDNATKELNRTEGDEARKSIKANIDGLNEFKADLEVPKENRQILKTKLQRELIQLNDSQFLYLQAKLNYINDPELFQKARDNAAADVTSAGSKESTLEGELNSLPLVIQPAVVNDDLNGSTAPRTREAAQQDLNSARQIRAQAETRKAELNDLENKLKDATDVDRESLKKALEGDLNLLSLQAKINYLDNPELLAETLVKARADYIKTPDDLALSSRLNYLEQMNRQISENGVDPQKLKSELQLQLNDLRANQGLSGLTEGRPDPNEAPLIALTSDSRNSFCFASPVGPGAALGGGSFMQGAAGSSLCDGTNGGMADASFSPEQQAKKPVYFSVIQYFELPDKFKQVSLGFRLAFVPGENPGEDPKLLGIDEFESQPGYGATFRFGVQQGLAEGGAECRGSADDPKIVAMNGGITTACPFAPDEAGEVAGQPFLSNLKLSYEIVTAQIQPPYQAPVSTPNGSPQPPVGPPAGPQPQPLAQTPAPLPIFGAGAAFAWSRRVRRNYRLVPAKAQIQA